jgi:hypothetical protein
MTDGEMIIAQARKIMEQEAETALMVEMLAKINVELIRVGAPLNDNFLQYSKEQLKPFFRIQDILNGCTD